MHSEAFSAGELKHGPIALIDQQTPVVAIASEPSLYEKIGSNMVEVRSRGATVLVITPDNSDAFDGKPTKFLKFQNALQLWQVFLQLSQPRCLHTIALFSEVLILINQGILLSL